VLLLTEAVGKKYQFRVTVNKERPIPAETMLANHESAALADGDSSAPRRRHKGRYGARREGSELLVRRERPLHTPDVPHTPLDRRVFMAGFPEGYTNEEVRNPGMARLLIALHCSMPQATGP